MNRRGPVRRRNAGCDVFARIDGHSERRAKRGGILRRLLRQLELFDPLRGQGETDQSTSMLGHEIDGLGRHMFGGNDKIAFVLTIFIIDEDDAFPLFDVFDCVFDTVKGRGHGFLQFRGVITRYGHTTITLFRPSLSTGKTARGIHGSDGPACPPFS